MRVYLSGCRNILQFDSGEKVIFCSFLIKQRILGSRGQRTLPSLTRIIAIWLAWNTESKLLRLPSVDWSTVRMIRQPIPHWRSRRLTLINQQGWRKLKLLQWNPTYQCIPRLQWLLMAELSLEKLTHQRIPLTEWGPSILLTRKIAVSLVWSPRQMWNMKPVEARSRWAIRLTSPRSVVQHRFYATYLSCHCSREPPGRPCSVFIIPCPDWWGHVKHL